MYVFVRAGARVCVVFMPVDVQGRNVCVCSCARARICVYVCRGFVCLGM